MLAVLEAALPYITVAARLLELCKRVEKEHLTDAQVEKEIAKIKGWLNDSESKERAVFAAAKKRRDKSL